MLTLATDNALNPAPLPFHEAMVEYLQSEEKDLWKWFVSTRKKSEHAEAVRLDLLKSTYRIEATTQPKLYGFAEEILGQFKLTAPITFYQAQAGNSMNAALAYLPGEVHIVLSGSVLSNLSEPEQRAVLGHELAHFLLFEGWDGAYFVATELLRAMSNDASATQAHVESARLYTLYTEVFADRGSYAVTRDAGVAIATLIKMETGLTEVSAESYLRQAEEIFKKSRVKAAQLTHPESYIRARALQLWAERGREAQPDVQLMVEGSLAMDRLDLLGQTKASSLTRRVVQQLLEPAWFHSESVVAHARLFFDDFSVPFRSEEDAALADDVQQCDSSLHDYLCYVLLDFVTVDRELGETALAAALVLSRRLGFGQRFGEIAAKELSLGKKQFSKLEREADDIVAKANKEVADKS